MALPLPAGAVLPDAHQARALHGAGALAFRQGATAAARVRFEAAIALCRATGDDVGLALSLA